MSTSETIAMSVSLSGMVILMLTLFAVAIFDRRLK